MENIKNYNRLVEEQGYPQLPFVASLRDKGRFSLPIICLEAYGIHIKSNEYVFELEFNRFGAENKIDTPPIPYLIEIDNQSRCVLPHHLVNDFKIQPGDTICGKFLEVYVKRFGPELSIA